MMKMNKISTKKDFCTSRDTRNLLFLFEVSFRNVESILTVTAQLFEDFQKVFFYAKQEQDKTRIEVRELFAKSISLRKKDFDHIMQDVLSKEAKREVEIKELLKNSFMEQKELAIFLRKNLCQLTQFLVTGKVEQIKEIQDAIKEMVLQNDQRKNILIFKLNEFKKEQQKVMEKLKNFLICRDLPKEALRLIIQELKTKCGKKD